MNMNVHTVGTGIWPQILCNGNLKFFSRNSKLSWVKIQIIVKQPIEIIFFQNEEKYKEEEKHEIWN